MAAKTELSTFRAAMDDLNLRLRDLLQERARLTRRIAEWKRARKMTLDDPAREAEMLAAVLRAPGDGFGPGALERLFRTLFRESRALVEAPMK